MEILGKNWARYFLNAKYSKCTVTFYSTSRAYLLGKPSILEFLVTSNQRGMVQLAERNNIESPVGFFLKDKHKTFLEIEPNRLSKYFVELILAETAVRNLDNPHSFEQLKFKILYNARDFLL